MATDTMLAVVKTRPERGVQITRVHVPGCRPMRSWCACGPRRDTVGQPPSTEIGMPNMPSLKAKKLSKLPREKVLLEL
jgi:hypothetical protein